MNSIPNDDIKYDLGRKAIYSKDISKSPTIRGDTIERAVTQNAEELEAADELHQEIPPSPINRDDPQSVVIL